MGIPTIAWSGLVCSNLACLTHSIGAALFPPSSFRRRRASTNRVEHRLQWNAVQVCRSSDKGEQITHDIRGISLVPAAELLDHSDGFGDLEYIQHFSLAYCMSERTQFLLPSLHFG